MLLRRLGGRDRVFVDGLWGTRIIDSQSHIRRASAALAAVEALSNEAALPRAPSHVLSTEVLLGRESVVRTTADREVRRVVRTSLGAGNDVIQLQ